MGSANKAGPEGMQPLTEMWAKQRGTGKDSPNSSPDLQPAAKPSLELISKDPGRESLWGEPPAAQNREKGRVNLGVGTNGK